LVELGENKSELAREMGVTPSAISQRLKKLDPGGKKLEAAKAGGLAAGIVHAAFGQGENGAVAQVGFESGVRVAADRFRVFDRLVTYCDTVDDILVQLKKEMDEHMANPKAKLKYHHVELVCKLVDKGAKMAAVIHQTRKDIYDMKALTAFYETVTRIMMKYDPEVRKAIFLELLELGSESQAELICEPDTPS
jgi:DNA-binding Lrp family transcriptional regulator